MNFDIDSYNNISLSIFYQNIPKTFKGPLYYTMQGVHNQLIMIGLWSAWQSAYCRANQEWQWRNILFTILK